MIECNFLDNKNTHTTKELRRHSIKPTKAKQMIIQNFGLHWREDKVNWGKKGNGNQGQLLGRYAKKVKSPTVDFRNQAGIYILQDDFKPIYIGQAGKGNHKLFNRLKSHRKDHLAERWDRFSWFGILSIKDNEILGDENLIDGNISTNRLSILNHLEGVLIAVTEPALNRKGGNFGDASQYIQVGMDDDWYEEEFDEEGE